MKLVLHSRLQIIRLLNIYTLRGCRAITTEKARSLLNTMAWWHCGQTSDPKLSGKLSFVYGVKKSKKYSMFPQFADRYTVPHRCRKSARGLFLLISLDIFNVLCTEIAFNIFSSIFTYTAIREQLEVLLNKLNWQLFPVLMGNQCVLQ